MGIFRRSDDPSNQNVYKTTADTAKFAASGYCFSRGSTRVYPCQYHGITDATSANAIRGGSSADAAKGTVTHAGTPLITPVAHRLTPTCSSTTSAPSRSAPTPRRLPSSSTSPRWTASPSSTPPLTTPRSPSTPTRSSTTLTTASASILLMNGRRYKTAAAQTSGSGEGGIALTETFAGSSYLEL